MFLDQKNISQKNISRLKKIEAGAPAEIATLAAIVREIARIAPGRRKRLRILRRQRPDLLNRAVGLELLPPPHEPSVPEQSYDELMLWDEFGNRRLGDYRPPDRVDDDDVRS
ncbi:MAG: hypothetical protein KatS3mg111_3270 [Pirellulaceae bacterium]|nr:MAG: hypothetical protein KatS3mg111_3270 [Pirellulaceae bacterium]